MPYVYTHTRLDTNEIFYVGIGSDSKYLRAYSRKRSNFWKNIVKDTDYKVNIFVDNISWEQANKEEIRLIKLFGRRDLALGTLVNMTNGGSGVNGYKHSELRLLKIKKNSTGSKNGMAKTCIHFDTNLEFNSLKEGCNYFKLHYGSQASSVRLKQSTAQFYFKNEYFKRPTREEISKKLGLLRIGNNNRHKNRKNK